MDPLGGGRWGCVRLGGPTCHVLSLSLVGVDETGGFVNRSRAAAVESMGLKATSNLTCLGSRCRSIPVQ